MIVHCAEARSWCLELKLKLDLDNLPPDGPTDRAERTQDDLLAEILDTLRSTSQENFRLLKFAIDGIVSVSDKIPITVPGFLGRFQGLAGEKTTFQQLTGPKFGSRIAALATGPSGADASTFDVEVSPASEPKKAGQKAPGKT